MSFKNFTSCTASLGPTMISHPGSFASRSPLRTATLPGITSLLHFTFGSTCSWMNFAMLFPENLPAAQDLSLIHILYKLPCVVAINAFPTDTKAELDLVEAKCKELGVNVALSEVWAKEMCIRDRIWTMLQ